MNRKKDPFGGIQGEPKILAPSPFKIDKNEALKGIDKSLDFWNKKRIVKKGFFHSLIELKKRKEQTQKAEHWEYSDNSKQLVNIHLVWSQNILRTLFDVPNEQVEDALKGLKDFYSKISAVKPDLSHPDILSCYNQTAKNYGFTEKNIELKDQIDVEIIDPFGGVQGKSYEIIFKKKDKNKKIIFNNIDKDKKIALNELNFSIKYFDNLDVIQTKKQINLFVKKPKNFNFSYETSTEYFDIYFLWAGKKIKSVKKVSKKKTRVALISMREFIESINTQKPDLNDPTIKLCYNASKLKYKPKKTARLRYVELLSVEDGGMSYWSSKTHRWIKGRFDKKKNIFIPPKKNL